MRSLADVVQLTSANHDAGLTADAVEKSKQQFGRNVLTPLPKQSIWKKFIEKFDEPIIKILLAAALLSMVVDLFKANARLGGLSLGIAAGVVVAAYVTRRGKWAPSLMFLCSVTLFVVGLIHPQGHLLVEGLAVMIAVVLATGVAFASEFKSDREFEVLNAHKDSIKVKVIRAGQTQSQTVEDVVVGDLVLLETGDEIPADGRLVKATELSVDQSLMTGESEPARKTPSDETADGPDQPNCLYRGTQVVDGVGGLLVTDVGDHTYLGQIARRLSNEEDDGESQEARVKRKLTISKELTPLQQKLTTLADLISKVGYAAAGLIFAAQLARGLFVGEVYWPTNVAQMFAVLSELLGYFVTMVIIIVVAVPEGLPMSVTVSLALAMQKMTRANSLVRQLVACETIGSATVICSDKTGTLTQNKMQVERLSWDDALVDRSAGGSPAREGMRAGEPPALRKPIDWMALISAVNSTAHLEEKQGKTITIGNSTEGALLHWLRDSGINYDDARRTHPSLHQVHFSSERKRMTTVIRDGAGVVALIKGAPEAILADCQQYLDADGTARALNEDKRRAIQTRLGEAAALSMRTLAFAYAPLADETATPRDLVYVGFVAIRDPLRPDVKDAIAECRRAGIAVKMITGDNIDTARAIGFELGLVSKPDEPIDVPGAAVISSDRLSQMSDDELKQQLPTLHVIARAKPLDKYRLVKLLQELGEVVAVTGDGTNDAPALKRADVGLAMGIAGTEVSKEASKIVLLDDSFATIVKAVQWGRSLYENIQRFIQFQLTINVSALAITFLGILFFGVKAPFTVLQLLWINVIMDTLASIALCSEPPRPDVMTLPPKRRDENIVTGAMARTIFGTAAFFVVVMLGLLLLMKGGPDAPGLFAGEGKWSVEVDANRYNVERGELTQDDDGNWIYNGQVATVMFTVQQVSLFFSIYVFFQVWNQINARSLSPDVSGFRRLLQNPTFLAIAAVVALGQIAIVMFGGIVFKVEPLDGWEWLGVIAFTSSVLIFAEIVRFVRRIM